MFIVKLVPFCIFGLFFYLVHKWVRSQFKKADRAELLNMVKDKQFEEELLEEAVKKVKKAGKPNAKKNAKKIRDYLNN